MSGFGKPSEVDSWFVLDTNTGKRTNFKDSEGLARAATQLGIVVNLEDIDKVYSRYRFTWFDVLVGVLLIVPLTAYVMLLARKIMRLRKTRGCRPTLA